MANLEGVVRASEGLQKALGPQAERLGQEALERGHALLGELGFLGPKQAEMAGAGESRLGAGLPAEASVKASRSAEVIRNLPAEEVIQTPDGGAALRTGDGYFGLKTSSGRVEVVKGLGAEHGRFDRDLDTVELSRVGPPPLLEPMMTTRFAHALRTSISIPAGGPMTAPQLDFLRILSNKLSPTLSERPLTVAELYGAAAPPPTPVEHALSWLRERAPSSLGLNRERSIAQGVDLVRQGELTEMAADPLRYIDRVTRTDVAMFGPQPKYQIDLPGGHAFFDMRRSGSDNFYTASGVVRPNVFFDRLIERVDASRARMLEIVERLRAPEQ